MNSRLKRIEATLNQLNVRPGSPSAEAGSPSPAPSAAPHLPPLSPPASQAAQPSLHANSDIVQPFPVQAYPAAPHLPRTKPPSLSHHRHAPNPNVAVGILHEVESIVIGWQMELEQIILQIQALYQEGPIVDGWLESHQDGQPAQSIGTSALRHAEIEHLMEYVEEICSTPQLIGSSDSLRTGYRLCGLDADGQLWSRPCPPQQVPYVSLAIARYQKLRVLLGKKQTIENRLNQLVQTLTILHGQIREPI